MQSTYDPKPRRQRREELPCVYCGERSTSDDHVPPKALFVPPRPPLITVRACDTCNNGASDDDEAFRAFMSVRAGSEEGETHALWQTTLRGIRRNRRESRRLVASMRTLPSYSRSGLLWTGNRVAATFPAGPHDRVMSRTTRGLYFHHFGERMPPDIRLDLSVMNPDALGFQMWLGKTLPGLRVCDIGGSERFGYAFGLLEESPATSLWLYQIYRTHVVLCISEPGQDGMATDDRPPMSI